MRRSRAIAFAAIVFVLWCCARRAVELTTSAGLAGASPTPASHGSQLAPADLTPAAATAHPPIPGAGTETADTPVGAASVAKPDGSLQSALRLAVPAGRGTVLLTFGDKGVSLLLRNFVAHASAARAPFVVGAVDAHIFDAMVAGRHATYKTPLALDSAYELDGSNAHASASWQRFAAMRTGEIARVVGMGYDVIHTDLDVVWLRNPAPYVRCDAADARASAAETSRAGARSDGLSCESLRAADVAVSSDNLSPGDDMRGGLRYAVGGTLNTGIVLVRATARGKRFASAWHGHVVARACKSGSAGDCRQGRCCTSDQQVFGAIVRDEKLGYPGIAVGSGNSRTARTPSGNATLGALPLALFMNGHGYFVQGAHARMRLSPYAVHATYTLDRHDVTAKAQRFREAGMWRADAPEPRAATYLALNSSVPPEVRAAVAELARRGKPPANIRVHMLALRSYVLELRDALALARRLGRTLVLPRWACYCDRLWSGSDDIFHFGCRYPGSHDADFVPFTCPMDHVLSPAAWREKGVEYRDPAFLDTLLPQLASGPGRSAPLVEVDVEAPPAEGERQTMATARAGPMARLPSGISDAAAEARLRPYAAARVLRLSHARGLLCGIEGGRDAVDKFNRLAASVLRPPEWCSTCFQKCEHELAQWLDAAAIKRGADGPNRWCARIGPPPPLPVARAGGCA